MIPDAMLMLHDSTTRHFWFRDHAINVVAMVHVHNLPSCDHKLVATEVYNSSDNLPLILLLNGTITLVMISASDD